MQRVQVNHEKAQHDPKKTKNNSGDGRRWEIGLWGKTKICLNPSLPLLATRFWEMNKTSWMLNFIISKTGTVISITEITFIN